MAQYAYVPIDQMGALQNPEGYKIRLGVYVPGFSPDILDSNNVGIPNIVELDVIEFTSQQKTEITNLGGQWFNTAQDYISWKESLINS
jgi:hypothetical protein